MSNGGAGTAPKIAVPSITNQSVSFALSLREFSSGSLVLVVVDPGPPVVIYADAGTAPQNAVIHSQSPASGQMLDKGGTVTATL
jgi:hypothetical protein